MSVGKVDLRPIEDSDLKMLHRLLNDSYNQQIVGGSVAPLSKRKIMEWIEDKSTQSGTYIFAIESNGEFCGYIQLVETNKVDGFSTLGINLLNEFQGKGVGRASVEKLHEFAKERLLLRKILLYVRSDNLAAINLYEKIGYKEVGRFLDHQKTQNGYVDLKIMEVML